MKCPAILAVPLILTATLTACGGGGGSLPIPSIPSGSTTTPGPKATQAPTSDPSPTSKPTAAPTAKPTAAPTSKTTAAPTSKPTATPTAKPTAKPTASPTAAPTAKPTASPVGSTTLTHFKTVIFGYGYNGVSTRVPLNFQQKYVTWAYAGSAYAAAYHAAGIKVLGYINYWRNYSIDKPISNYTDLAPGGADASAAAKTCSGSDVRDPKYGGGYLNDPRESRAINHARVVMSSTSTYHDAFAADDTGAAGGTSATPCNYNYNTWIAATNAVNAQIGVPMFINALNAWTVGGNPVTQVQLALPSNILGAQCEMCYANNAGVIGGNNWALQENAEIAMVRAHKIFWAYARNTTTAAYAQSLRTYILASFLLSYDPNYAMLEEAFATASNFEVMPETQLVALNPSLTASDITGYQVPGGAYWRQFGACYYKGSLIGKCAIAVNPGTSSVQLPANSYSHSVTVSGSDIYDGGSANTGGPKISSLGPLSGAVLVQ